MEEVEKDLIRIEVTRLSTTGMLIGFCSRFRGFVVHGRSLREMETRIPAAIRRLLDRDNDEVAVSEMEGGATDDLSGGLTVLRYEVVTKRRAVLH